MTDLHSDPYAYRSKSKLSGEGDAMKTEDFRTGCLVWSDVDIGVNLSGFYRRLAHHPSPSMSLRVQLWLVIHELESAAFACDKSPFDSGVSGHGAGIDHPVRQSVTTSYDVVSGFWGFLHLVGNL
jgi:hypothetical protein